MGRARLLNESSFLSPDKAGVQAAHTSPLVARGGGGIDGRSGEREAGEDDGEASTCKATSSA